MRFIKTRFVGATLLLAVAAGPLLGVAAKERKPIAAAAVERAGMKYVRIPMTTHKPPTGDQLAQFLALVNDPVSQPVYVHCAGGRHRTGVMTAVYRMTSDGWTSDQAFNEMKQYDFGADLLHPEFKRFVYTYRAQPTLAAPVLAGAATSVTN